MNIVMLRNIIKPQALINVFVFTLTTCILFIQYISAQVIEGGIPRSFTDSSITWSVQAITLPSPNIDSLIEQDTLSNLGMSLYGYSIPVNKGIDNAGVWDTLHNGRVWRLKIVSEGAIGIELFFDLFWLPEGADFFIYNEQHEVLGAFTSISNKENRKFTTRALSGDKITLEYYEPLNTNPSIELNICSVGHIFKIFQNRNFGDSQPCQNNVRCPKAASWCNQRRSVMLISVGAPNCNNPTIFYKATCALITNEKRDLTPYVLTAEHVANFGNPEYYKFYYNYQSPSCNNQYIDYSDYWQCGSTLIAKYWESDFALLKLNKRPSGGFNSYYSGWDNRYNEPQYGASIHHPRGDIKKISYYDYAEKYPTNSKWWRVTFNDGTMENGSSGAPLYNEDKRIVGNEHGPNDGTLPYCDQHKHLFGRFDQSWDYGNNNSERLKDWLNPSWIYNWNIFAMSGDEPCKINYSFSNANDLHTSANVHINGPEYPGSRTYDGVYECVNTITAGNNITIENGSSVIFNAGQQVHLTSGFHAVAGSYFHAYNAGCLRGCNTGVGKLNAYEDYKYVLDTPIVYKVLPINVEYGNNTALTLYPNPTGGLFTIAWSGAPQGGAEVRIHNLFGQEVYSGRLAGSQTEIDLSGQAAGVYLLSVKAGDRLFRRKLALR